MLNYNSFVPNCLIVLTLLNFSLFAQETTKAEFTSDYADAENHLFNLKLTGESAEISSEIIFHKDVGNFKLQEGILYKCSDYRGVFCAMVFIGKGEYSFSPPTEIEKKQLFRFYETENFQMNFKELFLLFDDSTYDEITADLTFQNTKSKKAEDYIKNCVKYFKDGNIAESRTDFLRSVMVEGRNGFFYAQIQERSSEPVFFQINPFNSEEVYFMRRGKSVSDFLHEVINQFVAQKKSLEKYYTQKPDRYFLDLISYKIESTIEDDLEFSTMCILDFKSLEKQQQWIMFYLYDELIVDSVKWEDGSATKFVNKEESGEIWIKCKNDYLKGHQHNLTIYYHGDLLEKNELSWIYLKSSIYWYPRYDNRTKVPFGLIFHTPAEYDFVSVGNLVNKTVNDDVLTTTWFCQNPVSNVSFNIGNFEIFESKLENLPDINVYISKYGHRQISSYLLQLGIQSMSDASEYIAHDALYSTKLFTELFGKLSINSINITETPYMHGEAFPGLIHLSWSTVVQTDFKGEDEIFRAHEVAHQWWGIGVDFDSYHDQWLSEGFAQYSGIWYLQAVKNDNDLFFDILINWKDAILNVREYLFGSGQEAGPIWLGYRTSSSDTPGDYNLIVYKKGAWVIHMLRAMLLDLNTMNEDRMKKMIREFYETYKNNCASTVDFKKIVDKHFGEDMSWFFNQYVYGTDIPLYKVAYKTDRTEDGKIKISVRVRQEDVDENFKMYVPIKLVLANDKFARIRIEVKGKETVFITPPIEGELDDIIFNDLESVLCEVEYEDWD
ncbi:MAG: hypothetical protein IH618_03980 [Ignavibacteriaceae bacterium]|nr:hypothetical protein [Ignavibacteriaceae bacterium]